LYDSAVGSFAQARDAAQQEEEEEHTDFNLKKVTIKSSKRGVASSTNMDFMRLRNGSTNDAHRACFKIMICIQELSPR
jgi:hypothetical protein